MEGRQFLDGLRRTAAVTDCQAFREDSGTYFPALEGMSYR
jgi:hypothetical protein